MFTRYIYICPWRGLGNRGVCPRRNIYGEREVSKSHSQTTHSWSLAKQIIFCSSVLSLYVILILLFSFILCRHFSFLPLLSSLGYPPSMVQDCTNTFLLTFQRSFFLPFFGTSLAFASEQQGIIMAFDVDRSFPNILPIISKSFP
jgi:hypothetical protein